MMAVRDFSLQRLNDMADEALTIEGLTDQLEGALEIIENIACKWDAYLSATSEYRARAGTCSRRNRRNTVIVDGGGSMPHVGALPEPTRIEPGELVLSQLCVDAAPKAVTKSIAVCCSTPMSAICIQRKYS
jgi:hypothetical protein